MALAQRFNEVTSDITHISELEVYRSYCNERADKVKTRFGETILLGIRETPDKRLLKVFLPQRYVIVFKDDDLQAINEGTANWNLVSKGRCSKTNTHQLAVEESVFTFQMDMPGVFDLVTSSLRLMLFTYR